MRRSNRSRKYLAKRWQRRRHGDPYQAADVHTQHHRPGAGLQASQASARGLKAAGAGGCQASSYGRVQGDMAPLDAALT